MRNAHIEEKYKNSKDPTICCIIYSKIKRKKIAAVGCTFALISLSHQSINSMKINNNLPHFQ